MTQVIRRTTVSSGNKSLKFVVEPFRAFHVDKMSANSKFVVFEVGIHPFHLLLVISIKTTVLCTHYKNRTLALRTVPPFTLYKVVHST